MTADVSVRSMSWEFTLPGAFAGGALDAAGARASDAPMDNEAFAAFYERSARPLWAYLVRVSGDAALAGSDAGKLRSVSLRDRCAFARH